MDLLFTYAVKSFPYNTVWGYPLYRRESSVDYYSLQCMQSSIQNVNPHLNANQIKSPRTRWEFEFTLTCRLWLQTERHFTVWDFLLIRHGPILHRFGDFAAFMCSWPHPHSNPNFGVFPLHQIAHVVVSKRISLKLFGSEIIFENFEVFQPMWLPYLNATDGRRLEGQTTCNLVTALCVASRGKNADMIRYR